MRAVIQRVLESSVTVDGKVGQSTWNAVVPAFNRAT